MMMSRIKVWVTMLIVFTAAAFATDTVPETPVPPARSPNAVLRAFFLAMLSSDEAAILKEILPNPDARVLWQGKRPPTEALAKIQALIKDLTWRELKVGDTFTPPGGKPITVTDKMVNATAKYVFVTLGGEEMPFPIPMTQIEDQWKVDAGPIIESRRAADRAR